MPILEREEYIEQAYLFRLLAERSKQNIATQDLLASMKEELLSTSKLPMALDFLVCELKFSGRFGPAMAKLQHYFHPFQIYLLSSAEDDRSRLDFTVALRILEKEAQYRAAGPTRQGMFIFQFEAVCRNRLGYDKALAAIAEDPLYDAEWRDWILTVRKHVGIYDFADFVYGRSEYFVQVMTRDGRADEIMKSPLFGEKEGKIAFAHRWKDPLFLFAALERHLGYPPVPRPVPPEQDVLNLPWLVRTVRQLEHRIKLLEEESRGGIDLAKLYGPAPSRLEELRIPLDPEPEPG